MNSWRKMDEDGCHPCSLAFGTPASARKQRLEEGHHSNFDRTKTPIRVSSTNNNAMSLQPTASGSLRRRQRRSFAFIRTLLMLSLACLHRKLHHTIAEEVDLSTNQQEFGINNQKHTTKTKAQIGEETDNKNCAENFADTHTKRANTEKNEIEDVIIVTTVDGKMFGLSKRTGETLWKKEKPSSSSSTSDNEKGEFRSTTKLKGGDDTVLSESPLLAPIVSTTTTVKSSAVEGNWRTAAVPSINGRVYLTAAEGGDDVTVTPHMHDLVSRVPFVDNRGRLYTGSRRATAVAVDVSNGEVLRVVSADAPEIASQLQDPTLQDHSDNFIWMGRVDYSINIHEPRSGELDVKFSASEIMSGNDMVIKSGLDQPWSESHDNAETEVVDNPSRQYGFGLASKIDRSSLPLLTTPSGNVALRDADGGQIIWVAGESFDTAVAYAVDSVSGNSLAVDIIPDAAMPNGSVEYLSKEMERQLKAGMIGTASYKEDSSSLLDSEDEQTICGSLPSGQLYAMPLSNKKDETEINLSLQRLQSSTQSAQRYHQKTKHLLPQIGGAHHLNQQHNQNENRQQHASSTTPGKRVPCTLESPYFPKCLLGTNSDRQQKDPFARGPSGSFLSQTASPIDMQKINENNENDINTAVVPFFDPDYGYVMPEHFYTFPPENRQKKRYQKILRILGSWLPPTIALIFVVSFELGRRKRQKDNNDLDSNELSNIYRGKLIPTNRVPGDDPGSTAVVGVIQVYDDIILGYGGHGTVVYKGMLEGRPVAVKRMLKAYHASADREISLLIESDGHPNVVRYFLKEVRGDFVYLALELCDLSLHDLVETIRKHASSTANFDSENFESANDRENNTAKKQVISVSTAMKAILFQIAVGVKHLHQLRIVHRDLKPANILLAAKRKTKSKNENKDDANNSSQVYETFQRGDYVAKISDMGLGKQLNNGQSSYGASILTDASFRAQSNGGQASSMVGGAGPGSVGWQAPEVMALRMRRSDASSVQSDESLSKNINNDTSFPDSSPMEIGTVLRTTSRSVDVFSLGCIFANFLSGSHPFGEWYEREANIMHNKPKLEALEEFPDAHDLIKAMIQRNPSARPTAHQICEHPLFWSGERKLNFLCDLSDKLESNFTRVEEDQPRQAPFPSSSQTAKQLLVIERNAKQALGGVSWDTVLDVALVSNVQRFRAYDPTSVRDLLRLIRNKHHHFDELPEPMKEQMGGSNTAGLMEYFEARFPKLVIHCFNVCRALLPSNDPLLTKYSLAPFGRGIGTVQLENSVASIISEESTLSVKPPCGKAAQQPNPPGASFLDDEKECSIDRLVDSARHQTNSANVQGGGKLHQVVTSKEDSEDLITGVPTFAEEDSISACHDQRSEPSETKIDCKSLTQSATSTDLASTDSSTDGIVVWEGSSAAKTFNCRGWNRSDDEWERAAIREGSKPRNKRDRLNLMRFVDDSKFRTRLCNEWINNGGTSCHFRRKNKCIFAHGPVELRVKEAKRNRWGKLVNENGDNSNPKHSGGEDTYGAAQSIETERKQEGKWKIDKSGGSKPKPKKSQFPKRKKGPNKD